MILELYTSAEKEGKILGFAILCSTYTKQFRRKLVLSTFPLPSTCEFMNWCWRCDAREEEDKVADTYQELCIYYGMSSQLHFLKFNGLQEFSMFSMQYIGTDSKVFFQTKREKGQGFHES